MSFGLCWPLPDEKRPGQLEIISGINYATKSRNYLQSKNQGSEKDGGLKFVVPKSQQRKLGQPPAHRDKTAMNGAQLLMTHGDSSELMIGPPATPQGSGNTEEHARRSSWFPRSQNRDLGHPASSHLLEMRAAICG